MDIKCSLTTYLMVISAKLMFVLLIIYFKQYYFLNNDENYRLVYIGDQKMPNDSTTTIEPFEMSSVPSELPTFDYYDNDEDLEGDYSENKLIKISESVAVNSKDKNWPLFCTNCDCEKQKKFQKFLILRNLPELPNETDSSLKTFIVSAMNNTAISIEKVYRQPTASASAADGKREQFKKIIKLPGDIILKIKTNRMKNLLLNKSETILRNIHYKKGYMYNENKFNMHSIHLKQVFAKRCGIFMKQAINGIFNAFGFHPMWIENCTLYVQKYNGTEMVEISTCDQLSNLLEGYW